MKCDSFDEMLSEAYKQFELLDKIEAKRLAKENAERVRKKKALDDVALNLKDAADKRALYLNKLDENAGRKGDDIKNKHQECADKNKHLLDIISKYSSITDTISDQDRETAVARLRQVESENMLKVSDLERMMAVHPDLPDSSAKPEAIPARPAKMGWLKAALAAGIIASGIGGYWAYSSHTADMKKLNEACDAAVKGIRKEAAKAGKSEALKEADELDRQTRETIAKINKNLAESGSLANTANGWPTEDFKKLKAIDTQNKYFRERCAPFIWSQPRNPRTEVGVIELEQRLAADFEPYLDRLVKENKIVGWERKWGRHYRKKEDNYELISMNNYDIKTSKDFVVFAGSGIMDLISNLESHNMKVDKRGPGLRGPPGEHRLGAKSPVRAKYVEMYLDQLVKDNTIKEWVDGATFFATNDVIPQLNADYAAVMPNGKMFCIKYCENKELANHLQDFSGLGIVIFGSDDSIDHVKYQTEFVIEIASCLDEFVKEKKIKNWSVGITEGKQRTYFVELADGVQNLVFDGTINDTASIRASISNMASNAANKVSSSSVPASNPAAKDPVKDLFANLETIMKKTGRDAKASDEQYALGHYLRKQGKIDDAVSAYIKAIELNPDDAINYNSLGFVLDDLKRFDDAVFAYKKAIELDPNLDFVHSNLGVALRKQGKFDEAVLSHKRAVELKPDNAGYQSSLGVALADQGKLEDAVISHKTAIGLDPNNSNSYVHLGVVLNDLHKQDDAISAYRKAIQLNPKLATAHNNLGTIFSNQGKLDDAVQAYSAAVGLDPKESIYHSNLGVALQRQGKRADAVLSFNTAISLNPKNASAYAWLGSVLDDVKRLDDAVLAYEQAIRLEPAIPVYHYNLAFTLEKQKKAVEARKHYQIAADLGMEEAKNKIAELEAGK